MVGLEGRSPEDGGPRFVRKVTPEEVAEARARRDADRRYVDLFMARVPSDRELFGSDVPEHCGGFEFKSMEQTALRWVLAGDGAHMGLPGGYHLCDAEAALTQYPLTKVQTDAMVTAATVEDHIPAYGEEYLKLLPIEGVSPQLRRRNRGMRAAVSSRWIPEEEGHARWLIGAVVVGKADRFSDKAEPVHLFSMLNEEVAKGYTAPFSDLAGLSVYTSAQEKATALFYRCLSESVDSPLVKAMLDELHEQEMKHCGFFVQNSRQCLLNAAPSAYEAVAHLLRDKKFEMPLARMMSNYKRQAVNMIRATGGRFCHLEGLQAIESAINHVVNARRRDVGHRIHELSALLELNPA